ncbi:Multiple myeloma tumor-associated protein 2-like protein [Psilocybe cubensis]|uniref:Multiple myeloma tumor-associated protein 2-like protein n=1 Tax=Psilocybe cubensis TaxID=181762 RepID=A0ACB8H130_PSICU|nr:Multiple myeloma tumor-associated protein 2-like protein [Psilocybe cubensis]KAH9481498.1 Multiple myeloma tumor-associated protein 2-like protein [Psilocybe cubensis]
MFEPVRGGTRGGQAEFKWSDVSADKDRENYLGHSINAPTGRWQKNKDVHWYNRDVDKTAEERAEEIRKIKEMEADALAVALGFEPASKTGGKTSGANSIPVASSSSGEPKMVDSKSKDKDKDKEERRRLKEERKAEKRARKELKKMSKSGAHEVRELSDHVLAPVPPGTVLQKGGVLQTGGLVVVVAAQLHNRNDVVDMQPEKGAQNTIQYTDQETGTAIEDGIRPSTGIFLLTGEVVSSLERHVT